MSVCSVFTIYIKKKKKNKAGLMLQENRIIPLYFGKLKTFVGPLDSLGPRAMPERPIG